MADAPTVSLVSDKTDLSAGSDRRAQPATGVPTYHRPMRNDVPAGRTDSTEVRNENGTPRVGWRSPVAEGVSAGRWWSRRSRKDKNAAALPQTEIQSTDQDASLARLAQRWLLPGLFGAIAGRAALPGEAFPLAAGYIVALLAQGDRRRALAASLGCIASMAFFAGPLRLVEQGLILLIAWLATLLPTGLHTPRRDAEPGRRARTPDDGPYHGTPEGAVNWGLPFVVLLGTVFLRVGMLFVIHAQTEMMIWAAGESVLEFGAALALIPAAALHRGRPRRLGGRQVGGLVLALAGVAWVLTPMTVAGLSVGQVLIFWAVLMLALAGGPALAAPAGAGLGALSAAAGAGADTIGLLALAGLGAGLGQPWGKPGVLGGLVGSQLTMSLFGAHLPQVLPWLVHGVAAGGALALYPAARLAPWLQWVRGAQVPSPRFDSAAAAHQRVGSEYLRQLSHVFDELAQAFGDAAPRSQDHDDGRQDEEAIRLFLEGVTEKTCRGCTAYRHCWEDNFYHTYRDLIELASVAEQRGKLTLRDIPAGLRRRCIQQHQLLRSAGETFQLVKLHRTWEKRFSESRELVPQQLRGVARLVRDMAVEIETVTESSLSTAPGRSSRASRISHLLDPGGSGSDSRSDLRQDASALEAAKLSLETAVVQRAKDGSFVSGDSDARISLGGNRLALVLSDGMGAGERAAMESQAVVRVLRRLLEAGFDRRFAVKMVNSVLLLRSSEETFATIDMAIVDLTGQQVEFLKIGAPPTFIKRGQRVDLIRGASLPAGILQQLDVEAQRYRLQVGDLVVMLTDGLLDILTDEVEGEQQVIDLLRQFEGDDPAQLARYLLGRLSEVGLSDDVTLLVARVCPPPAPSFPDPQTIGVYRRR